MSKDSFLPFWVIFLSLFCGVVAVSGAHYYGLALIGWSGSPAMESLLEQFWRPIINFFYTILHLLAA